MKPSSPKRRAVSARRARVLPLTSTQATPASRSRPSARAPSSVKDPSAAGNSEPRGRVLVTVPALAEVDLGQRGETEPAHDVHQETDLDCVAAHERQPLEQRPPPRRLARERLHERAQLGIEEVDERPGADLRDAAA